jgi:hypothetical protein
MEKGGFNLFLLIVCLVALPLYLAGAVLELLLEGGQKPIPVFRPSRRSFSRPSSVSVCPCCGSYLRSRN